jgi:hypothetical protein
VDHFLDHQEFTSVLGFELADLAVEEAVELVGRLAGDEDGVGREGVGESSVGSGGGDPALPIFALVQCCSLLDWSLERVCAKCGFRVRGWIELCVGG